jgi:hypothetical protein
VSFLEKIKGLRKFLIAVFGLVHTLVVWITCMVCGIKWPDIFPNIISISIPVITFVGAITMVLIGGQSVVDYKNATVNVQQPPG